MADKKTTDKNKDMHNKDMHKETIVDRAALQAWFQRGETKDCRIGAEHEKVLFHIEDLRPPRYEVIRELLEDLQRASGGVLQREKERPIGLELSQTQNAISIEPAGQFEFAGAPLRSVHEICLELKAHLSLLRPLLQARGLGMCAIGARPRESDTELPWMPKERYAIMRKYMARQGKAGVSMMGRTATVQANVDFTDERDMVCKMRIATALQPAVTALFAHSPYAEGKANGILSNRAHYWLDSDPQRCGLPLFVFDRAFGYEGWRDYALPIPLYCLVRGENYVDTSAFSFADYLDGTRGEQLRTQHGAARTEDWASHMRMIFPDVRLKRVIEMRGADSGDSAMLCALPALWSGLLYDEQACAQALLLAEDLAQPNPSGVGLREQEAEDSLSSAHRKVPRLGLATPCRGRSMRAIARDMLDLARQGLERQDEARRGSVADAADERPFLEPLENIIDEGRTPAERLLSLFAQPKNLDDWKALYDHCSY